MINSIVQKRKIWEEIKLMETTLVNIQLTDIVNYTAIFNS